MILALLVLLHWSTPAFNARPNCCEPDSTSPCVDLDHYNVYRRTQSAFYLAHRDSMIAHGAYFAAHWGQCKAEAAPVLVGTTTATSWSAPDSACYDIRAVDHSGNVACAGRMWP